MCDINWAYSLGCKYQTNVQNYCSTQSEMMIRQCYVIISVLLWLYNYKKNTLPLKSFRAE